MIGKTVFHYRIFEKIGAGGMGIVYRAEDIKLKRTVALKFLPSELTRDADAKARFIHEAQAASALDHPNICTVHDIQESPEGHLFMVMPCYEGWTLKEITGRGGLTLPIKDAGPFGAEAAAGTGGDRPPAKNRLPIADVIDIAIQIGEGLKEAHRKAIVHRDLKPANVFVTRNQVVKILDFGIAKLAGGQTKLTKTGATLGTAHYMSPEQALGKDVDQRTDIWSFGVVLYEMVSGELPFPGDYAQAVIYSILNEEAKPIHSLRPGMPRELQAIIGRALKKDRALRYQNCDEILADLKRLRMGGKPSSLADKERSPARISRKALVSLIGMAAVLAAAGIFLTRQKSGNKPRPASSETKTVPADWPKTKTEGNASRPAPEQSIPVKSETVPDEASKTIPLQPPTASEKTVQETATIPVLIRSNARSKVLIDDRIQRNFTGRIRVFLRPGKHEINFIYGQENKTHTFELKAGDPERVIEQNFKLFCVIEGITAHPWGKVFIDDKEIGVTPIYQYLVPSGQHSLRIEYKKFQPFIRNIACAGAERIPSIHHVFAKEGD